MSDSPSLGNELRRVRSLRGLPLKAVAEPAGISIAYLQKLERDEVKSPSPHVLFRLSQELGVPYPHLMELVGYVVPRGEALAGPADPADPPDAPRGLMSHALATEPLTEDEANELARYLSWYRHQKREAGLDV
jgi:HTH-type transcriptional regulator, competence development regulator